METRRVFLAGLMLTAVSSGLASGPPRAQDKPLTLPRQEGRDQDQKREDTSLPNPDKKLLEENDKDMKKKVERLYQLVTELKEQVDKTDSSKVLSLNLMKKAEEIEKLARDIKNRSKG
jgi:predicted RNase H-like nuclease (RuvC/YqgF family)